MDFSEFTLVEEEVMPMGTDSLYYIMDYSGNYYRTNQSDQLVAVAREQDATVFSFTQANSRICKGKKSAFYCMIPIEEMQEENQNEDEDKEGTESKEEMVEKEEAVSTVKELTYDEITELIEKSENSYNLSAMDWSEYLTHFAYLVEGIKGYRDELSKKHSDIDQKISDILHYIELCETSDDEASDLVELLRVCRENRRDIKDELQKIEYFQTNLGTNANAAKARQALKAIKGLENRKYKPRKYEELFENSTLKEHRLQKDDLQMNQECNESRNNIANLRQQDEGEEQMMEERTYTPFDGRNNDWLQFARQQAEFYRNAGAYIRNLQIDIREIDDEIEEILEGTEEANCNVAQGYKIFKRLKELRLERKAKAKELDCLYALTDYIDCKDLADTCEANLKEVEGIMEISETQEVEQPNTLANLEEAGEIPEERVPEIKITESREDMVG